MIWRDDTGGTKPFLEHLEDLRKAILWSAVFLAGGLLVAIPLAPTILRLLKVPLVWAGGDPETFLRVLRVAGGFSVAMKLIFWSGLLFSIPFISLSIAWFVFPGLTRKERKTVLDASGFAVGLFAAGVCLGYFVTLPVALKLMFRVNRWLGVNCEFVDLADYAAFVLRLLLAFGLSFELPVILVALGAAGVVTSQQLRSKRRHVIVLLMVVAMLLTPPDPLTLVLMAAPLALLYEMCIWMIRAREKKREAEFNADVEDDQA